MSTKNGKSSGDKKKRTPKAFTALVHAQIDALEKKHGLVSKNFGRAGLKSEALAAVTAAISAAREAIGALPHDFKPARGGGAAPIAKGSIVEIVPELRADLSALGESVAAGQFEVMNVSPDGKTLVARSKVNTDVITSFARRQVQAPGTVRKPRKASKGKAEARA